MKDQLRFVVSICLLWTLLSASTCYSRTWHVRQDGTGDTVYLMVGLSLAQAGDTVLVGPGLYQQERIYLGPVHLISEAGPESTIIELWPLILEEDVIVIDIEYISNCSVIGFTIRGAAGGLADEGGGILCNNSSAVIENNIITNNWCANAGGMSCLGPRAPIVENNLFYDNSAVGVAAIEVYNCSPIIRNNTIVGNHASTAIGALDIEGDQSFPTIVNNIIVRNTGGGTKAAIYSSTPASQVTLSCNDVWGNTPTNYGGTLTDQTGMNGNISADPLFCGATGSGNYYLQVSSPCAAGNTPAFCNGASMGCYPVKCTVSVKKNSWGDIKSLFREGNR